MKKVFFALVILCAFVFYSFSQEQTDLRNELVSRFVGEWVNLDLNTCNLTKVIITNDNNELLINAFGKCHPIDCEWGKVKIHEIAASINNDNNVLPFDYLLAFWEIDGPIKNAMTEIMKITIDTGPKPKLHIETVTIYNDNSGRRDYHWFEIMKKEQY